MNEMKKHACDFADWKEEYMRWYSRFLQKEYKKAGGIFSTVGPFTADIYDKWLSRIPMSFDEAMIQVENGQIVTTDYLHAVHSLTFKRIGNEIYAVHDEYGPNHHPWNFENSEKHNKFWKIVKEGESWKP